MCDFEIIEFFHDFLGESTNYTKLPFRFWGTSQRHRKLFNSLFSSYRHKLSPQWGFRSIRPTVCQCLKALKAWKPSGRFWPTTDTRLVGLIWNLIEVIVYVWRNKISYWTAFYGIGKYLKNVPQKYLKNEPEVWYNLYFCRTNHKITRWSQSRTFMSDTPLESSQRAL